MTKYCIMEIKKYSSHFLREDRAGVHSDMLLVVRSIPTIFS